MKNFLIFIYFLLPSLVFGSHIVGGEIFYDCLGGNQYRVTVKVYRDCNSTGAQYDPILPLSVFDGNGMLITTYDIPFPGSQVLPIIFDNPCITPPTNICTEEAIYQADLDLPQNTNGLTLTYQRCCRGPNIINLLVPDDEGLTLTTTIPPPSTGVVCNSSPRFNNFPPLLVCNNDELIFDHSATDPDGDLIEYELCAPYQGGTSNNPAPNPASPPAYSFVTWENGFSEIQPFGANGPINLNLTTGQLNASPQNLGLYVVGVCAKEYRNGVLIGETRRDFLFSVINCDISLQSNVTVQEDLSTFISYCQGLTVQFENESFGGTNYFWDFGVDSLTSDTSNQFEPTYTFPTEGTFDVTLVVNPGWTCTDTAVQTFTVFNQITASFPPMDSLCITGNSYDLVPSGTYSPSQSVYSWDFGQNANPSTAATETVNNVVFSSSGNHVVTFEVDWNQCNASYSDTVFIYQEPTIDFTVDPGLKCAPYRADFTDSSLSDAPVTYFWDFGDGNTSTFPNPNNIYEQPGLYTVTLNIQVTEGCVADLTLVKPGIIDVKPKPVSSFSVSPTVTDVFHPRIDFFDSSIDGIEHFYFFDEDNSTTERNTFFNYLEGGVHRPYQLVINEFGCRDSSFQAIYVEPLTTLYVPNSFTPNGDEFNNEFKPIVFDVAEYELLIYDRWGNKIFESFDREIGWNGTLPNGNFAKTGVYVWYIRFTNSKGVREVHYGHLNFLK